MYTESPRSISKEPERRDYAPWSPRLSAVLTLRRDPLEFAVVLISACLILTALALRTTLLTYQNPDFQQPWDHHKYIRMAQGNPFDFHIAPFAWRVVTPLLAKLLPFSLEWNFFLIAFLSIALTGVVVYYITRALGASRARASMAMLLFFALGFTTKATLSDFWLSDPLSMLVMTTAILCILLKNDLLFVVLLTVGEGVRETVILVAPLYYTLNARRLIEPRLALRTVLFALPPLAVFIGLRVFIPEMNNSAAYLHGLSRNLRIQSLGRSGYSEETNVLQVFRHPIFRIRYSLPGIITFARNCLIWLPFLPFVRNRMLALRFAPYALLLYCQMVVIVPTARYLLALYPVAVVLASDGVEALSDRLRIPITYFVGLPLLFIILNLLQVSDRDAPGMLQVTALVVSLLLLLAPAAWRRYTARDAALVAD